MKDILVNGAFRGQVVTGQQRYADEISRELLRQHPDRVREITPRLWWQGKSERAWIWSQTLAFRTRKALLISLTSRSPLLAYRHILVVHDIFVLTHPEWYSRKYVLTHAPVLRLQLRTASAIITVSEPVSRQVLSLTRSETPVIVAPNAPAEVFSRHICKRTLDSILSRLALESGRYILSVASKDPRKNLATLVRSYLALPQDLRDRYPLVLVGGSSSVFASVEIPMDDSVRHLGYVSDEELAALYYASSFVAFPSLDEGFGLPAVEALSAGARLLVSDVEVMRWVCSDFAEYIDPQNEVSVTKGLRSMLETPDSPTLRAARRDYANTRFTWQGSAAHLASSLNDLYHLNLRDSNQTTGDYV